jgi:sec-independent protein translocase protein TatB
MFGIGPQEMLLIGVLLLVVFGPAKLPSMARNFGRFVTEARRSFEDMKSEFVPEEELDEEELDEDVKGESVSS